MNKLIYTKNRFFISLVGFCGMGESQPIHKWLKVETFSPKFAKIYFYYQASRPIYDVMQKDLENLEFIRGVIFQYIDSVKTTVQFTCDSLTTHDSCEEVCNLKVFIEVATTGSYRGLSTIYFKHNLFHQSKLKRDVELQNTQIVLFKSPQDVMQVSLLSAHLSLGSELVDWYRDATSVP